MRLSVIGPAQARGIFSTRELVEQERTSKNSSSAAQQGAAKECSVHGTTVVGQCEHGHVRRARVSESLLVMAGNLRTTLLPAYRLYTITFSTPTTKLMRSPVFAAVPFQHDGTTSPHEWGVTACIACFVRSPALSDEPY